MVTVTRIDRLARSAFDLLGIVKRIVDAKGQFRSLAEPWADTGTGRLTLADPHPHSRRWSRAKAEGKLIGRPRSLGNAQTCYRPSSNPERTAIQ